MRKTHVIKSVIFTFAFIFIFQLINAQIEYGSWVVPEYQFNFYDNGPVLNTGLYNPGNVYYSSDAGFLNNGDLLFYIIDDAVFDASSNVVGYLWSSPCQYEVEVVKVPGETEKFYAIGGHTIFASGYYKYALIDCTSGTPQLGLPQLITSTLEHGGIAITELNNNTRDLYIVKRGGSLGEVEKYQISNSGFSYVSTIVTSNDPVLNQDSYFNAINVEFNEVDNTLAWCTLNNDDIYIVNLDAQGNFSSSSVIQVNKGYVSGIEFSDVSGSNTLYASCQNQSTGGIQQINYQTGVMGTPLTTSGSYGYTFLQKASDGYIYAVSNAGDNLGRIDQTTNTFTNSVISQVNIKSSEGGIFKLPENKTVYSILGIDIITTNVSCPGHNNGSATAIPLGGTPPYTYLWSPNGETTQTIDNLEVGPYSCCITDALGDIACDSVEITLPLNLFDYDQYNINYPVTLNSWDKSFENELRIGASGDVTLTNCNLQFGKYGRIVIEPGGKLTLNNCNIKEFTACGDRWIGIEVQGASTQVQTETYQGKLVLNNTTIENATKAVLLAGTTPEGGIDFSKTGGIINATDADFINNNRCLSAYSYQNMNGTKEYDNVSSFIRCDFEVNSNYIDDGTYYSSMIYMYGVRGISFKRCDFVNNKNISPYGKAINTQNAGFKVDGLCPTGIVPCDPADYPSTFTNFKKAILASGNGTTRAISIRNSEFINNSTGIEFSMVTNPVVLFCDFQLGKPAEDEQGECETEGKAAAAYGIDMAECTGFAIEENEFSKYTGVPVGNYIGVRVNACPSVSDDIYLNEYTGMTVANLAEGTNRSIELNDFFGVSYICNENSINNYDFYVADESMIRGNMGSLTTPSGNKLTDPINAAVQFQNDYTQYVNYYYNNDNNCQDEWLIEYSSFVYPHGINYSNTCPSHYGGGGSGGSGKSLVLSPEEKSETEQEYYQSLSDYTSVETLYNNLQDGGDTESLQSEIENSWPNEMWELRAELLGNSPHLSKEVLMTAADKTDVLPESVLFEILSANPDELRKEELISYLENKDEPLPGYMIEILKQLAGGVTYKTILQSQMSDYHHKKVNAAQDMIRSILNDNETDFDELRNWLDNIGSLVADKQIISTYLSEANFTDAQTLLNMLPTLYDLSGDELLAYNDYKSFVEFEINLSQQGRSIFDLQGDELVLLENLAENGCGSAKASAQGILEFAYGHEFCDCPSMPEPTGLKSSTINYNNLIKANGLVINVEPNPASTWVSFKYQLPVNEGSSVITISDVNGKVVDQIHISNNQGHKVWDVRDVIPGVYLYEIKSGGLKERGKLIIK